MRPVTLLLLLSLGAAGQELLGPASAAWDSAPVESWALHRTPPLYATDSVEAAPLAAVEVRFAKAGGKTFARLEWPDASRDAAELPQAKAMWQSEGLVVQSEASDRFFDACALMTPAGPVQGGVFPSLQMGDAGHPVVMYYYSAARGAAVMEGAGRGTTRRTGETFPARAAHEGGRWAVVMEVPELATGTPVAAAIWDGRQQDRDGRKYFSTWYKMR